MVSVGGALIANYNSVLEEEEESQYKYVMLSGTISGVVNSLVMSPTDRIKILLQLQRSKSEILKAEGENLNRAQKVISLLQQESTFKEKQYSGPLQVIRQQKLRGLMRGYTSTLTREFGNFFFIN